MPDPNLNQRLDEVYKRRSENLPELANLGPESLADSAAWLERISRPGGSAGPNPHDQVAGRGLRGGSFVASHGGLRRPTGAHLRTGGRTRGARRAGVGNPSVVGVPKPQGRQGVLPQPPLPAPATNHAGRVHRPRFGGAVCERASAPPSIGLVAKSWGSLHVSSPAEISR